MRKLRKTQAALNLPTLKLEGGLFLPDQLEKAALGSAKWQTETDYLIPKGLKLKDDYSRAFQIASAQYKHFAAQMDRADVDAAAITQHLVFELLRDAFGYSNLSQVKCITVGERHYPVQLLAGNLPIVVAPHTMGLDDADARFAIAGSGSRKKSAFQLAQELLNASSEHLWAIVSNGKQLRLLRDAATLTRPSFLEVDLQDLLSGQRYAEFTNVWRLLHASRAGNGLQSCIWESWREAGQEEGTRVRDGLRLGVTQALLTLGEGFLQHHSNEALRRALHDGELSKDAYFQQLLRLVYRLIFLFSVEERGLLHPADENKEAIAARRAYSEGYAVARLRELCLKRRARNRFEDHWQALRIVFKGLSAGEPRLALPALGGLFAQSQCPSLDAAHLSNADLLAVMQNLRWANHGGTPAPVDYRNMGPEELGSVYESLLELVPEIDLPAKRFGFIGLTSEGSTAGNARKLTGSYYTPDSLVQELIKSALDPVIQQRLADNPSNPVEALLAIRVIDPACGSGHFLLAAARRLAEKLVHLQTSEGAVKPQDYRHALREVVSRCIFGVDRNPMALELARTALWLEGFEEGRPLGFLDHHLQCGDALLGLTDLKSLQLGIAKDAFRPLSGDDKEVCKVFAKANATALRDLEKKRNAHAFGQFEVIYTEGSGLAALQTIEALPQDSAQQIANKEAAYHEFLTKAKTSRLAHAADLVLGAFLLPKTEANQSAIPTSGTLYLTLLGDVLPIANAHQLAAAQAVCLEARVLHWPLAFPQVFAAGGFDCVLGNPPWERIKLQEEEFFATRHSDVVKAKNKAERSQRIRWLSEGMLAKNLYRQHDHSPPDCEAEQRLYAEFISARRTAEAASLFAHVKEADGGRYPLTGVGDVNTYALFAETISQITQREGRAGFIVPTGIATDDSTKAFFSHITQNRHLVSMKGFWEIRRIFPGTDSRDPFCLLTLGFSETAEFIFLAKNSSDLLDRRRIFSLSSNEFRLINPNTLTCPVFRSECDAELTKKIYRAVPVLIEEGNPEGNPWGISFMTMMHMSNDSHLFENSFGPGLLPLYEAKMIHQYDHRWGTYTPDGTSRDVSLLEKADPDYSITPRYWVSAKEVSDRLQIKGWNKGWLMGWRGIARASDERSVIGGILPLSGVGNSCHLVLPSNEIAPQQIACLISNISVLIFDFVARQKIGGANFNFFIPKQLPVLPPSHYVEVDLAFIVPRVLELTYISYDLTAWAQDLGFAGQPFIWDEIRRSQLRAELDAYYARLYGLTRDELRYILDPADLMGPDYPSETFRVLKNNETKAFGEYRTQRLVMREFDRMTLAEASGEAYVSPLVPPPGQQAQPTYSERGALRDELDARLAGLLLTLIQKAGRLARRKLIDASLLAARSELLSSYVGETNAKNVTTYQNQYAGIFESTRLAGDRIQSWIRYFEASGLVRVESDHLVALKGRDIPAHLIVDTQATSVASILLNAAEQMQLGAADEEIQTSQQSSKKA
ncbi:Eco57I restriction-modification methylase domain-containing protein [Pseudomonas frederiksbergensis]|uniref:Eco57I restriction-modification methylase domain-containing protein n=1 Tax=Pseudomonas frederiksbergensis TaxID=104087 RepID=UPI000F4AAC68|nr:N-6 DNA methylase [Pseudomonas frederiksbergensis]RON49533.1 restriction endonuclease [Pseudomonas frederiksbergensis]